MRGAAVALLLTGIYLVSNVPIGLTLITQPSIALYRASIFATFINSSCNVFVYLANLRSFRTILAKFGRERLSWVALGRCGSEVLRGWVSCVSKALIRCRRKRSERGLNTNVTIDIICSNKRTGIEMVEIGSPRPSTSAPVNCLTGDGTSV